MGEGSFERLYVNSLSLSGYIGVLFTMVIVRRGNKNGIRTIKLLSNLQNLKDFEQVQVVWPDPEEYGKYTIKRKI